METVSKAFVISAVSSGSGKTTLAMGLMAALKKRGLVVQPFKTGPDYIDPGYHTGVAGNPSFNLDTWMMGVDGTKRSFERRMEGADVGIVEGVMGLFDGKNGRNESGSTAHLAKVLGLKVILVVDAKGMAGSVAAIVCGFEKFDPDLKIAGVIFNRVGSERHFEMLKHAVEAHSSVKVYGYLPTNSQIALPERHLGLVLFPEIINSGVWSDEEKLVELIEKHIDIDTILSDVECTITKQTPKDNGPTTHTQSTPSPHLAIAFDKAFCFYYRENLEILKELGAKLTFFSPLTDKKLPDQTNGIYLGGGYPELHAASLEENEAMREEIKTFVENGRPVYAECGGLMYLGEDLITPEKKRYEMTGIFPWSSKMLKKRKSLGYREVTATHLCPFLEEGAKIRGHEFHYSELTTNNKIKRSYIISGFEDEGAKEGYVYKNTLASYVHLHFVSNIKFAEGFISRLTVRGRNKKTGT